MIQTKDSNLTFRPLTIDDAEQYNALLRYAFQVTEQELSESGWKDDEIKQSKFPVLVRADVLGCFCEEDLVSQFAVYPLDMNIYGVRYPVGFVTSVCTYPEYTGQGIMKKLMIRSLTRMRENHRSFALLYPYSIPLYRNLAWEEYFRWDEDDTVVAIYYSADDVPYGYMVYLISSDIMHIKEMIYLNREAQLGLWEYIHAHDSMIDEVKGNNYYSEPIAFELEDSDIKETIRPYSMGRIIDVVQFMEHYACDPDEPDVCIRFEIEDELLPWNNDSFTFFFEKGHCVPTDREPDHVMKMTIASLTTLLLGYKTASKLYEMARIETTPQTVECLDDLLFHHIPYVSDYI